MTEARRKVSRALEREPAFDPTYDPDMSRREWRRRILERVRAGYRILVSTAGNPSLRQAALEILALFDPSFWTRFGVHFGLFQSAINGQGDEEQQTQWMQLLMGLRIYGAFGMTELGHGSFVRGLETTATYIPPKSAGEDGTWSINTPSLTATKWWIGAAAHTATHCAVFAQTVINGKRYGVHTFVVPIRDLDTMEVKPGVIAGDIGKKMGRDGIDNGFLQFHDVRVPRRNMLMKHAVVDREGKYESKPKSTQQMEYFALVAGRATMVKDSADWMKKALTIAIRYSAIRRQGESVDEPKENGNGNGNTDTSSGNGETQILDYLTHQYRLMPLLAESYALHITARYMKSLADEVSDQLGDGDASGLPDMHATSAGLKSFCTWSTYSCIETCRHCIGGHGYSAYTGLSKMLADFAVQCTWEGDNVVLALQTARYLFRCFEKVQKGEKLIGSVRYLCTELPRKCSVNTLDDWYSWDNQSAAFQSLAKTKVTNVGNRLLDMHRRGISPNKAWNDCSVDLFEASKIHVYWSMAMVFNEAVEKLSATVKPGRQGKLSHVLASLKNLFVLNFLNKKRALLLELGYLSTVQSQWLTRVVQDLCGHIRHIAVPLVDAFDFTDFVLESPLGRADGEIYKAYMAKVVNAPGCFEGAKDYKEDLIKPMLTGEDVFRAAEENILEEN